MLQDMGDHVCEYAPDARQPAPQDLLLGFREDQVILDFRTGRPALPTMGDARAFLPREQPALRYIISVDGCNLYATSLAATELPNGFRLHSSNIFFSLQPTWLAYWGAVGRQLHQWYADRKYCGRCGHAMRDHKTERALRCENCNLVEYPRISPAVIVGVTNGDKLLMTKAAGGAYRKYALVAGYVELGETLQATAAREVLEETGVHIQNIRYFDCQPWPLSGSLLMGFFADLAGDDQPVPDGVELKVAKWIHRDDIPEEDAPLSLTHAMVQAFRARDPRV